VDWLKRERAIIAYELAPLRRVARLPRATPLPGVTGISVASGASNTAPGPRDFRPAAKSLLQITPPLPCDRLQGLLARRHRSRADSSLLVLTAVAIAASVAYYLSTEGFSAASDIAHAAALLKP
jgi:hypothetical protein